MSGEDRRVLASLADGGARHARLARDGPGAPSVNPEKACEPDLTLRRPARTLGAADRIVDRSSGVKAVSVAVGDTCDSWALEARRLGRRSRLTRSHLDSPAPAPRGSSTAWDSSASPCVDRRPGCTG